MKSLVLITILNVLVTWSYAAPVINDQDTCLVMTPEKQQQIKFIEKKISELLLKLENKIGDIIITDVTVNITKYSDEAAKKDINLVVSVNDCADVNKTTGENIVYFDEKDVSADEPVNENQNAGANVPKESNNVRQDVVSSEQSKTTSVQKSNSSEESSKSSSSTKHSSTVTSSNTQKYESTEHQGNGRTDVVVNGRADNKDPPADQVPVKRSGLQPCMELMILELDAKEEKLVEEMEKKRGNKPFLLIEHSTGQREIKFI